MKDENEKSRRAHVRALAKRVIRLTGELNASRAELLGLLYPNEKVVLDEGTFQAVPTGWRPGKAFATWIHQHNLTAKVTVLKPSISMQLVNALGGKNKNLAAYITLSKASAAERLSLRWLGTDAGSDEAEFEG